MPDSIEVIDLMFPEPGYVELLEKLVQLSTMNDVHTDPTVLAVVDPPRAIPVALPPQVREFSPITGEISRSPEVFQLRDH